MGEVAKFTAPPSEWIDRIFQRLAGMYGAKWLDMWRGTDMASVKAIWRDDLTGYQASEIKRGLDCCKTHVFPPTLPEFLTLCRPPINPDTAFTEAVQQLHRRKEGRDTWSHPAIYWAAQSIGSADMLNATWQTIKGRWNTALNDMLADMPLPAIPEFAVALPPPGKTSIAPEEAKTRIAEAVKSISVPTDHKAWAKKLIAQEENGEKPNPTALRMAQEALGINQAAPKQKLEFA